MADTFVGLGCARCEIQPKISVTWGYIWGYLWDFGAENVGRIRAVACTMSTLRCASLTSMSAFKLPVAKNKRCSGNLTRLPATHLSTNVRERHANHYVPMLAKTDFSSGHFISVAIQIRIAGTENMADIHINRVSHGYVC